MLHSIIDIGLTIILAISCYSLGKQTGESKTREKFLEACPFIGCYCKENIKKC